MEVSGKVRDWKPSKALIILALPLLALACSALLSDATRRPDLGPYRGVATWLDNWDWKTWHDASRSTRAKSTIADMKRRGVRTLFLATSHHSQDALVVRPKAVSRTIEAAHDSGMDVVAWYQPSLVDPERDYRRAMAAIRFRTSRGEQVDSFALDIEARIVTPVSTRNARLLRLASRIREAVGSGYALGAIVPSPRLLDLYPRSWPGFPFRRLAESFDVFLPMAYWTFHASTRRDAYEYARDSIAGIRHATRNTDAAVHAIGGTARHATSAEVRGFLAAARDCSTLGISVYDYLTTSTAEWRELSERPLEEAKSGHSCSWGDRDKRRPGSPP